jgi:hypothetical protein
MADLTMLRDRRAVEKLLVEAPKRANRRDKYYLNIFWAQFPLEECRYHKGVRNYCLTAGICFRGCLPRRRKMQLLTAMAGFLLRNTKLRPTANHNIRQHYNKTLRDEKANLPCFICGGEWHHKHHIIQIQHGGRNLRANWVCLCRDCHREVHRRAVKIFVDNDTVNVEQRDSD